MHKRFPGREGNSPWVRILAFTIEGAEYVLAVLEDSPGRQSLAHADRGGRARLRVRDAWAD